MVMMSRMRHGSAAQLGSFGTSKHYCLRLVIASTFDFVLTAFAHKLIFGIQLNPRLTTGN